MIFLAAMVAVCMTSCTNSEILDMSEGRAISFKNAVMTRASALESGTFNICAFKAAAGGSHTGTALFEDVYTLGTDKYGASADKMYYYDGVNSYWFYGYAKTNATTTTAATGFVKDPAGTTFTVAAAPSIVFNATTGGNIDLVVMATGEKTVGTAQNSQMPITFYHALSRVRFTAKTTTYDEDLPIKITGITFTTPQDACTVTGFGPAKANLTVTATGSTTKTYSITSDFQDNLTTTAVEVNTTDQVFFVVPQNIQTGVLKVKYKVNDSVTEFEKTITLPNLGLLAGNSYNFELTINLNEITFNASLEDWVDITKNELPAVQ